MKLRNIALLVAIVLGFMLAAYIYSVQHDADGKPYFITPTLDKPRGHGQLRCDYKKDIGCGIPNAKCAKNRVGLNFMKDGVVYTCKGPKPYRWSR